MSRRIFNNTPVRSGFRFVKLVFALLVLCAGVVLVVANAGMSTGPSSGDRDREIRQAERGRERARSLSAIDEALTGLARTEAAAGELDEARRRDAIYGAKRALARIDAGRTAGFDVEVDAWQAYLTGAIVAAGEAALADRFEAACAAIAAELDRAPSPFLAGSDGVAKPLDSLVAAAALGVHDRALKPRFSSTIARFVQRSREHLDRATGLLPNRADAATGETLEGARGRSAALAARFALDIDEAWARSLFEGYRAQFIGARLGVPGAFEHPNGGGSRDAASGLLVLGMSAPALASAIVATRAHGDEATAHALECTLEGALVPISFDGAKHYALGLWPGGDALIAWAHVTRARVAAPTPHSAIAASRWRIPVHVASLLLFVLLAWPLVRSGFRKRARTQELAEVDDEPPYVSDLESWPTSRRLGMRSPR